MIEHHLPALQVVLPLISAPLIVLVRQRALAWAIATIVSLFAALIAMALAWKVADGSIISYAIGNWPPPWGIEYRVDSFNAFVLVLVSVIGAVIMPYAHKSVAAELPPEQHYLFYAMYCLCLAGLLGITITGDVFNLFVFLEISSLSSYVLIALGQRRRALFAAYQYLVMGTIGATFYVIGIGLLYLMTGTLNMADLARRLRDVHELRPVIAALAFITVGMALKTALFPLHQWLPNAYAYAPSTFSAFIAATATKVSVYVLFRFYFVVFGGTAPLSHPLLWNLLVVLSVLAIVTMSLAALFQDDFKRMLAYSSVAQVGYITLGLALANEAGLTGAIAHLFNHGITKAALFLLAGGIALRCGGTSFADLAGIGRRMPLTSFGIVLAGFSLIGLPTTAGFVTKWYLVVSAIERQQWWLVATIVGSSLIAAAYVWRFVEAAYLREPQEGAQTLHEMPLSMLVPAWILVLSCIYFGLETSFNVGYAQDAARLLLRVAP